MRINQQEVWATRIMEILITRYGYSLIKVQEPIVTNDLWLTNPLHPEFALIRISPYPIANDRANLRRLLDIREVMNSLMKAETKMLCIHVCRDEEMEVDENIVEFCIYENYRSSDKLDRLYPEIFPVLTKSDNIVTTYNRAIRNVRNYQSGLRSKQQAKRLKDVRNWPVSYFAIAVCLVVFVLALIIKQESDDILASLVMGSYYKTFIYGCHQWWRLLTSGFVHVDPVHLMSNLFALNSIGQEIEKIYGRKKTLITLIVSILGGSVFNLICEENIVCLGISGGVYGLVAMLLMYAIESESIKNPQVFNYFLRNMMISTIISFSPTVSLYGHLGGFVTGLVCGVVFSSKDSWKNLRLHTLIASVILLAGAVYLVINDKGMGPLYLGTDPRYLQLMDKLGFHSTRMRMEEQLLEYYDRFGY